MEADRLIIPGVVQGGMVVPQNDTPLPDGARVDIVIGPAEMTPELKEELDAWQAAGAEGWGMIEELEKGAS